MSQLDALPADQRAVISLVLAKGRGYAQIATLLAIDETAVRERAHAALDALAPRDLTPPPPDRRRAVADFLLGQADAGEALAVRTYLESSSSGRAWARGVRSELGAIATGELPAIPEAVAAKPPAPVTESAPQPTTPAVTTPPSSRRGGAILLGTIAAAIVAAVVLVIVLSGGGNGKKKHPSGAATTTASPSTKVLAQINLTSPQHARGTLGVATLVQQGSSVGLAVQAVGLQPTHGQAFYALWEFNSPRDTQPIGLLPAVKSDGRMSVIAPVPTNISRFRSLVVTRQASRRDRHPGPIVLLGRLPSH